MGACDYDADSWLEVTEDALVKQAEPALCNECGETIEPWLEHRRVKGEWTGEEGRAAFLSNCSNRDTIHYCPLCDRVRRDLIDMGYCITMGDLWAIVEEIEASGEDESKEAA